MGEEADKLELDDLVPREEIAEAERRRIEDPASLVIPPATLEGWLKGDKPQPRPCLLEDSEGNPFLISGKTALLVAPGGGGKTGLLTQLAVAVAAGTEWIGHNAPKAGKVLLALGEEDAEEVRRRIYHTFHGQTGTTRCDGEEVSNGAFLRNTLAKRIADNLVALPLYGQNPRLMEAEPYLQGKPGEPGELTDETPFYRSLIEYIDNNGPWALIIIDPASRFMGAEVEVDNAAATRFVELLEEITKLDGNPAVIAGHHTNKSALNGATDQGAARGSSALVDGVRWVANIELVDDPEGLDDEKWRDWRRLKVVKTNYTKRTQPDYLKWSKGGWEVLGKEDVEQRNALILEIKQDEKSKANGKSKAPTLTSKIKPRWD